MRPTDERATRHSQALLPRIHERDQFHTMSLLHITNDIMNVPQRHRRDYGVLK